MGQWSIDLHQWQFIFLWTKIISVIISCLSYKITEGIWPFQSGSQFSLTRSSEPRCLMMTSVMQPFQSKIISASKEPSSIQRELGILQLSPGWHSLCPPILPHPQLSGCSLSLAFLFLTPPLTSPPVVQLFIPLYGGYRLLNTFYVLDTVLSAIHS